MIYVFCCDPDDRTLCEEAFRAQAEAALASGGDRVLVDHDEIVLGELGRALRGVSVEGARVGVYRGWMLTPDQYSQLYAALGSRGIELVNDPPAYRHCHYLPESYARIEDHTPRSVWLPAQDGLGIDVVMDRLREFGDRPVVLKDYVKSVKHAWEDACFIPSASDEAGVSRVLGNFLDWQGQDLNEGLVFREFVELVSLGAHPQSGMPLTKEYRVFFWEGQVLAWFPYWESEAYDPAEAPPLDWLTRVVEPVQSKFFSADVAQQTSGDWLVIELGDGQVAGLPEHADTEGFYRSLTSKLARP